LPALRFQEQYSAANSRNALSLLIIEIHLGPNKRLYYALSDPTKFNHLLEQWNSFSHINVTSKAGKVTDNDAPRKLASILIDADAEMSIFQWNCSESDLI
jgi:hypothetical protein